MLLNLAVSTALKPTEVKAQRDKSKYKTSFKKKRAQSANRQPQNQTFPQAINVPTIIPLIREKKEEKAKIAGVVEIESVPIVKDVVIAKADKIAKAMGIKTEVPQVEPCEPASKVEAAD